MTVKVAGSASVREVVFSPANWSELEIGAGVVLTSAGRGQLLSLINAFLEDAALQASAASPSDLRKSLSAVGAAVNRCRAELSGILRAAPPANRIAVQMIGAAAAARKALGGRARMRAIRDELAWLHKDIEAAASMLPDGTGRPKSTLHPFLLSVHQIFASVGGDGLYTKKARFFRAFAASAANVPTKGDELESVFRTAVRNSRVAQE